jgi:hypothetical protein
MHQAGIEGVHFLSSLRDLLLFDALPGAKAPGYFQKDMPLQPYGSCAVFVTEPSALREHEKTGIHCRSLNSASKGAPLTIARPFKPGQSSFENSPAIYAWPIVFENSPAIYAWAIVL